MGKYKGKVRFLLTYTVMFIILFFIGYIAFWTNDRSLIWGSDGLNQHYPAFAYLGKWLRGVARSVLSGSPHVPLYDFSLGLGDDVMAPLLTHSASMDVFNLLSVLVPFRYAEAAYNVVVVLRVYAAGLTFAYCCKKVMGAKPWTVRIGMVVYAFCGWAIFVAARHPHFMTAMVYTPLLVAGLDAVLRDKKPYLFMASIFLSALTGYYFLYMETLFLLIYACIRVRSLHKEGYAKYVLAYGAKTAVYYLIGALAASIVLVPLVVAQWNSSRPSNVNVERLFVIDPTFVRSVLTDSIAGMNGWVQLRMAAIVLPAVAVLAVTKMKYGAYFRVGLGLLTAVLIIPFGSLLFNGFGYVSQRWTFLFAFALAFFVTHALPHMIVPSKRNRIAYVAITVIYGYVVFSHKGGSVIYWVGFGFLVATIVCLSAPVKNEKVVAGFLTLIVMANLVGNMWMVFDGRGGLYASEFTEMEEAAGRYASVPVAKDFKGYGTGFVREVNEEALPNASMLKGYHGVSEYYSMMNPSYTAGMLGLENGTQSPFYWKVKDLDDRAALHALTGVRYIVTEGKSNRPIPYGYSAAQEKGRGKRRKSLYYNQYSLPIAFAYDKAISIEDYEEMDGLRKQEALLQAVALPNGHANTRADSLRFEATQITGKNTVLEGVEWKDGTLSVLQAGASITMDFEGLANSETYVRVLGYDNPIFAEAQIVVEGGGARKKIKAVFAQNGFYFGRNDYLVNLGYSEQPRNQVKLTFAQPGTYALGDVQVHCYPMDAYPSQVQTLAEHTLENMTVGTNRVKGEINLDGDHILFFSIPYSGGWSATVDGKEQKPLQTGGGFMALPMSAGSHTVEMSYVTPGLVAGIWLSLLGVCLFIATCRYQKRGGKKDGGKEDGGEEKRDCGVV